MKKIGRNFVFLGLNGFAFINYEVSNLISFNIQKAKKVGVNVVPIIILFSFFNFFKYFLNCFFSQ